MGLYSNIGRENNETMLHGNPPQLCSLNILSLTSSIVLTTIS